MKGSVPTSSSLPASGVNVEQRIIDHLLLGRVKETVITLLLFLVFFLDIGISTEDGHLPVSLSGGFMPVQLGVGSVVGVVVLGGAISRACVGTFLGALLGGGVGVFGLVWAALALRGEGDDFGGSGFVGSVTVRVSVEWSSALLGTTFLRRLSARSHFGVSVTAFSISKFDLDGLPTLLGGGFGRSRFVVIVGVSDGSSFVFGFLGSGNGGGIAHGCASQELLLDGEEAGVG